MRLLWEENVLGAIGALIVGLFALSTAWLLLEGFMGVSGWVAGPLSAAAAVGTLEAISRREYADEPTLAEPRDRSAWSS